MQNVLFIGKAIALNNKFLFISFFESFFMSLGSLMPILELVFA